MGAGASRVYLDHAATSWPKPPEVIEAVRDAMVDAGGNPGRSAHALALAASRTVAHARAELASLLGVEQADDLVFTSGCTMALNVVLKGALASGCRVVAASIEHNAVARPLQYLSGLGVEVEWVPVGPDGVVDADDVERAVASRETTMVVCQHASNVTGAIQPIGDLADIAHEHGAVMLVDGAQAAGHVPLDLTRLGVDAYACPGHKGLLGPQGVGVLYLRASFEPQELVQGGGGESSDELAQPRQRPGRYEAGTLNTPGVAGLGAGASLLDGRLAAIAQREGRLARRLHEGLAEIPGIRVLGPAADAPRVPVVSVVHQTRSADEIAFALDSRFGVAVRSGLHCNPLTHKALGTLPEGAVRFSLGWGLDEAAIDYALGAMREICA